MDCDACGYEWAAVHPVVAEYLECPVCHHMTPAPYIEEPEKHMLKMIAKFKVTKVENFGENSQQLTMMAVSEKPFDAEGASEDNSFAKWTPSGELKMTITNPVLIGKLKEGEKYYLNFVQAD